MKGKYVFFYACARKQIYFSETKVCSTEKNYIFV